MVGLRGATVLGLIPTHSTVCNAFTSRPSRGLKSLSCWIHHVRVLEPSKPFFTLIESVLITALSPLCHTDVNWAWVSLNFLSQTSLHHMVHHKTNISVCCVFMSLFVIYWESVKGSKQALLTWSLYYSVNQSESNLHTSHLYYYFSSFGQISSWVWNSFSSFVRRVNNMTSAD